MLNANIKNMNTQNAQNTVKFEVKSIYLMGWIGDSEMKTKFEVVKRTKCFVVLKDIRTNETTRCKINIWDGSEQCMPMGIYSMAPKLMATKKEQ